MTRQRSALRRKQGQNLMFAALGLALAGIAWIAMAWLMQRFQAARCSESTFFWASGQIATAFQVVPLLFPSLGIGFLATNWIAASIPGEGRFFRQSRQTGVNFGQEQRQLIRFCLIMLAVVLPISVSASLCQFCLQRATVEYQPYPWTGFRHYIWQDVVAVTATCHYRIGRHAGWREQLILAMRDGATLDLMTWPMAAVRACPAVVQALHGQDFSFDRSSVEDGCPPPYLDILTQRP